MESWLLQSLPFSAHENYLSFCPHTDSTNSACQETTYSAPPTWAAQGGCPLVSSRGSPCPLSPSCVFLTGGAGSRPLGPGLLTAPRWAETVVISAPPIPTEPIKCSRPRPQSWQISLPTNQALTLSPLRQAPRPSQSQHWEPPQVEKRELVEGYVPVVLALFVECMLVPSVSGQEGWVWVGGGKMGWGIGEHKVKKAHMFILFPT